MNANLRMSAAVLMLWAAGAGMSASASERGGDLWKEAQLTTTYSLNRHLNPFDIDINVNGDKAVLRGQVESAIERDLAEQLALGIDGIERVDNGLKVGREAPRNAKGSTFASTVSDASITASVKSRLLWNSHTDGLDISVTTTGGHVSLSGSVESAAQAALAREIAANTDGVRTVSSSLMLADGVTEDVEAGTKNATEAVKRKAKAATAAVKSTASDAWVSAKVTASMMSDQRFRAASVQVKTDDGVVTLTGDVPSLEHRRALIATTHDVVGVRAVDASGLHVKL